MKPEKLPSPKKLNRQEAEQTARQWRDEHRLAISEANDELRRDGLWSDGLRLF